MEAANVSASYQSVENNECHDDFGRHELGLWSVLAATVCAILMASPTKSLRYFAHIYTYFVGPANVLLHVSCFVPDFRKCSAEVFN